MTHKIRRRRTSKEEIMQIRSLSTTTISAKQIADQLELSEFIVRRVRRNYDMPRPKGGQMVILNEEQVVEMFQTLRNQAWVAKKLGYKKASVRNVLVRRGYVKSGQGYRSRKKPETVPLGNVEINGESVIYQGHSYRVESISNGFLAKAVDFDVRPQALILRETS